MPNYRRAITEGRTYFFTVVTYQRQPFLCPEESRTILRSAVQKTLQIHPFCIDAWVLLPDHMHCMWTLPEGDSNYSTRWALIKKEFTKNSTDYSRTRPALSASRRRRRESTIRLVIICRRREQARRALEVVRQILGRLGLRLHPGNTRLVSMEEGSFEFLGYTFRKVRNVRTGKVIPIYRPSQEAMKRVRAGIQ